MGICRKVLKGVGVCYALYAGIGGAWACHDYLERKETLEARAPVRLISQRFEIPHPTRPVQLTIIGEYHIYNDLESRLARELVARNDVILTEGADTHADIGLGDELFMASIVIQQHISYSCWSLGNGSNITYPTLTDWGVERKVPVTALENDAEGYLHGLDLDARLEVFTMFTTQALFCPDTYRRGRDAFLADIDLSEEDRLKEILAISTNPQYAFLIVKRDLLMAHSAAEYLKTSPFEHVLLVTGAGHTPGVIRRLTELTGMRPMTPLQLATDDPIAQYVERNLPQ